MSTRSTIGILRNNKIVEGIYCHSDGYLAYNGVLLGALYNTKEKVEQLISMGMISSLGYAIKNEKADQNRRYNDPAYSEFYSMFTFKTDYEDEKIKCSLDDFTQEAYCYVFNPINNKWMMKGGVYWNKWIELPIALHTEYKRGYLSGKDITALAHFNSHQKECLKYYPQYETFMKETETKLKSYIKDVIENDKYEWKQKISYTEFAKSAKYWKSKDENNVVTIIDKDLTTATITIQYKKTKQKNTLPILNFVLDCFEYTYYVTNPSNIKTWKQFQN